MQNALDYVSISGYRSVCCIDELQLRPINILVGANGSGKSNVISIFTFLNAIRRGNLQQYTEKRGGADSLLHFGSKFTEEIIVEVSFGKRVNGYRIALTPTAIDGLAVKEEKCWFWEENKYPKPLKKNLFSVDREAGISRQSNDRVVRWVQKRFDGWRIYHFHDTSDTSAMKKTADIDDNQFFRADGSNLPAYLLFLKEQHAFSYRLILNMVRKVTPFLKDFQLLPLRRNENKIRLEWIHQNSDRFFDVSSLSDGTLRFICLAVLLLQPVAERPSAILLDEPELGLHPYAIAMLATMIKSASKDTQIIASTQSPILLDNFEPEDILVANLDEGATTLSRLEPDSLATWLEDGDNGYSLGQLWEKNYFGGRPSHG